MCYEFRRRHRRSGDHGVRRGGLRRARGPLRWSARSRRLLAASREVVCAGTVEPLSATARGVDEVGTAGADSDVEDFAGKALLCVPAVGFA